MLLLRQDLAGADLMWAARYSSGDVLLYSCSSQETCIAKGDYARVLSVDVRVTGSRSSSRTALGCVCEDLRPASAAGRLSLPRAGAGIPSLVACRLRSLKPCSA